MKKKIPKETLTLLLSAITKLESEDIGKNIGERITEDFFLRHSFTSKIKIQDVPNNIALFFETYFSYTPQVESNIIILNDFYGFEYSHKKLELFKVLLEVIYGYLCEKKVEIEVDGSTLLVRSK